MSEIDTDREVEIIVIDTHRDGVAQISEALSGLQDIEAVHFVTHGSDGAVQLGASWLNNDNLEFFAADIESWQQALTEDADLLFYGCELAAGDAGQTLLGSLSTLTGADVAASDDITGHRSLGGDWDLEYTVGRIEADVAFSIYAQQSWMDQLAWLDANTGAPLPGPTNGADLFIGDAANDININADNGDDVLYGNGGDDDLIGGMHNDLLLGGAGMDTLTGQSGDDILLGGAGDDSLDGGSGVDILIGDGGNDILTGGNDDDLFLFSGAQDGDVYTVDGGNHYNTIDVSEFGAGNVTLGSGTITVDLGGGQSFEINHTNVQNIVLVEDGGNHAAQADAGPDQSVATSSLVTLDASGSSDPDSDLLTYDWQQIEGTWVTLSDPTAVSPTFTAPASADVLKFAVTVSDATTSDVDIVQIKVGWDYLDRFDTDGSFAGDDGLLSWSNEWQEIGESNGAGGGDVQVSDEFFGDGGGNTELWTKLNKGVWREADLSGAVSATLSFDYARADLEADDHLVVYIQTAGGTGGDVVAGAPGTWDEIGRYSGVADDAAYLPESIDISGYIASDTRIMFLAEGAIHGNDKIFIDNVRIDLAGTSPSNNAPTATNLYDDEL